MGHSEPSNQQLFENTIRAIRPLMSTLLQNLGPAPIRIFGDTPTSILDPANYLQSISQFALQVQDCVREHNPKYTTRFVAASACDTRNSYFVVDINNFAYDYQTAHLCETPIPVYVLCLSNMRPTLYRKLSVDISVAWILKVLHNGHGQDPLPLFDNHHDLTLRWDSPRSPQQPEFPFL
ncbi:hypothetical protein BJX99DRAFT_248516 [Aspergillus californicus]